ncbi:MAG TPA: GNAT family N-acetyltransferase [Tepidisphaeraceae bacterium]|jgi:GNAT superfamily N-acetyltransferase
MKLPVITVRAAPSPESEWVRFADVAMDHALALGDEVTVPGIRGVIGDEPETRSHAATAIVTGVATADAIEELLSLYDAQQAAWPRLLQPDAGGLAGLLRERGFRPREARLLRLRAAAVPHADAGDVLVVPGRAARGPIDAWAQARSTDEPAAALWPRHLDDPQYEAIVALRNGRAVAAAGLQTRGQTGLLIDLFVNADERLRGLGTLLANRATELAARSQLADVFATTSGDDEAGPRLMERVGFATVREFVEWHPPLTRRPAGP